MERREDLTPNKKDKAFKLYINKSNIKVWEAIAFAEAQGISPSDYLCKIVMDGFNHNKDSSVQMVQQEEIQSKDLINQLVSIAIDYENNGVDGLDISYLLPRRFDQGLISRENLALLGVFLTKSYITFMETGNVRQVLSEISPLSSKRDINSVSIMEQFKQHLIENIHNDPDKLKREEENRLRLQKEERLKIIKQTQLENIKQEKHDWELLHPDIPFYQKDMTFEQREVENRLLSGDYTIIGSDEELQELESEQYVYFADAKYETLEKDPAYKSEYYPALEKYLNLIERHIN